MQCKMAIECCMSPDVLMRTQECGDCTQDSVITRACPDIPIMLNINFILISLGFDIQVTQLPGIILQLFLYVRRSDSTSSLLKATCRHAVTTNGV